MQKVAWPAITVKRLKETPSTWVKVFDSATPVTIPGSAIGRMTRNETVSRPKKRWRATASDASVPRISAIAVATNDTLSEVSSGPPGPALPYARENQCNVRLGGGRCSRFEELNE